ncbi:MAG TPA: TAT-variant-translocated molybdopterin oxidoreductase [Ohtaekwangia sp.]|uniref:TAT-variant-translocated molybdopterin oxidoreductase n=1 Tax=Ohtaekwangia sp. TaxID=2066019 RepID=UPI002F92B2A7
MEESKKVYWKGIEQLANNPEFVKNAHSEFAQPGPEEDLGHSRRDFLKMMGFGMSAVALAACEAPIRKAIPYVNKPVDIDPSLPNYYASSYINGGDYASIVVKTREGRPIKIDGNALSSVTKGGTSAQVEASVLSLYDNARLRGPKAGKGEKKDKISWEDLDKQVITKLNEISGKGGQIRIVSNTILSPSTKAVIEKFKATYPTAQLVQYDQTSAYGIVKANEESFGAAVIPSYDFSKAKVIVSVAADFIGSWISPIEFTKQYALTREVTEAKREMSRHYQFESILSITGANADYRSQIKPSEEGAVVVQLYNLLAGKAGRPTVSGGVDKQYLQKAADELWANRGNVLVVAGSNDKSIQVVVNAINEILESYGTTIDLSSPVHYRQGDDVAAANFVSELEGGKISAVIFYNSNPVYDYPAGDKIAAALKNVELSVATSYKEDETATLTHYLAPDHHFLEAWNDAEPKKNFFSLGQPAITPIFKSRQAQESLLVWANEPKADYFEFVKNNWKNWFYKDQSVDFQSFWDKCLYDGVYEQPATAAAAAATFAGNVSAAADAIASNYKAGAWELVIYESGNIGNGSQANNPLLQELPDPITKATWDHYVTVAPKDAKDIDFSESVTKYATISIDGKSVKLPMLVQPGQTPGTIGIPVGYGRTKAGKAADGIGQNIYPFIGMVNGSLSYSATVKFEPTKETYQIAQTQTHNTYMGRETVVQETLLTEYKNKNWDREFHPKVATWTSPDHKVAPGELSLWKGHEYNNHHWAMSIDLNTCTGCAACVVACNVENNVALVGREEVINRREMHWLRIDRYYSSDAPADDWRGVEVASENPEVVFQPMLCQHCNNAPCETVCPVAATTHSTEGLNQMTYNRCIGTRYCANNCPYKVRRFNWFKYHDNSKFESANPAMNTDLGKMVLNPDVTVRSRGVMEKCSFCVQRIQAGKLNAKKERRPVKDGEVTTACAAACSTGAIVFGDINNPESKISQLLRIKPLDETRPHRIDKIAENPRAYQVLEEIGVKPNIWYLTKVRNKDAAKA